MAAAPRHNRAPSIETAPAPPGTTPRWAAPAALAVMVLGVLAVYLRSGLFSSRWALVGVDYFQLHLIRIRYAQAALDAGWFSLPGWFTREALGAPFAANIQSFPWIPTRLPLLLLDAFRAYAPAVALSAALTALFTYLFARSARLSPFAAAAAGWTFACSGFFASRVMAGQLTILEAFPSLPCLLWLADRACRADPAAAAGKLRLLALAVACAAFALAGHPQFPAYAMIAALAYVAWTDRRRAPRVALAMLCGGGLALFAWWPMFLYLVRSSRLLVAGRATNDVVFPWWRLGAFVLPWKDGWTSPVVREPLKPFVDSNPALFWDTVCYSGIVPLAAVVFVVILLARRRPVDARVRFALAAGVIGLIVAAPPVGAWLSAAPVIIFRSTSRLLYFAEFALALALAAALDGLLAAGRRWKHGLAPGLVVVVLAAHAADLSFHDRAFVRLLPLPLPPASLLDPLASSLRPGEREAIDHTVVAEFSREFDDAGFYDSLMPAHTYQALVSMRGAKALLSTEIFDASVLNGAVLRQLGVKLALTPRDKPELRLVRPLGPWKLYAIDDPVPRATFVAEGRARRLADAAILEALRTSGMDLRREVLFPDEAAPTSGAPPPPIATSDAGIHVNYDRPSSDEASASVEAPAAGYVRLTESWDPGWRAFLDGAPAEILRAEGFLMAVRVPAGAHTVVFRYSTPGKWTGIAGTLVALAGLALCLWKAPALTN